MNDSKSKKLVAEQLMLLINSRDMDMLFEYVRIQVPQVIAFVVHFLQPSNFSYFFSKFPKNWHEEILKRMMLLPSIDKIDDFIIKELYAEVEKIQKWEPLPYPINPLTQISKIQESNKVKEVLIWYSKKCH